MISQLPVIIIAPSTGHKNDSSSVSVLLNIAGVDANLEKARLVSTVKGESRTESIINESLEPQPQFVHHTNLLMVENNRAKIFEQPYEQPTKSDSNIQTGI